MNARDDKALASPSPKRPKAARAGQGAGIPAPLFGTSTRTPPRSLAPVSAARSHLAAELYDALGSFPAVGRCLGLDHSSVLVARRRWLERSATSRPQETETRQDWGEVLP